MYQVYKITCSLNGKVYIGYTAKGVDARFQAHINNAKWNRKTALYDAIRVYGKDAFSVELLKECDDHAAACALEIHYIKEMKCLIPHGYNMTTGGDGVPLTPEVIARAAEKKRGKFTEKQAAAASRRKGKPLSLEHKLKLSMAHKGRKKSEEWKQKLRASNKVSAAIRWRRETELQAIGSPEAFWTEERRSAKSEMVKSQWTEERRRSVAEKARQRKLSRDLNRAISQSTKVPNAERMVEL